MDIRSEVENVLDSLDVRLFVDRPNVDKDELKKNAVEWLALGLLSDWNTLVEDGDVCSESEIERKAILASVEILRDLGVEV